MFAAPPTHITRWNRPQYTYTAEYSPLQPFIIPQGLDPMLSAKMMQASAIFRMFDTDRSGNLSKDEFERACFSLGLSFDTHQAKRLFHLIDQDGSGRISEREFCEFWITTH